MMYTKPQTGQFLQKTSMDTTPAMPLPRPHRLLRMRASCFGIPSRFACVFLLLQGLQGCVGTPPANPVSVYDFGALHTTVSAPAAAGKCVLSPVHVADITSPGILDNDLMHYRLGYANDQRVRAYANNRWSMPPAQLLGQRIKARLADAGVLIAGSGVTGSTGNNITTTGKGSANAMQLRLELDDFTQYFSDASHSQAQLSVRVSLLRGSGLVAQTTLNQQVPGTSPDAAGGAKAMQVAADALINELYGWLCTHPQH